MVFAVKGIFRFYRVALALFFILLIIQCADAQNATGSLLGEVQDASGARIKSATVTVTASGSGITRQVISGSRGEFRFPDLMPGSYRVVVNAKGFAEATTDVTVLVSNVRDLLVTLRPEAVQQSVNVKAQASSITTQELDTTDAVNGGVVTGKDLETIPLAARSFANIAYMVAGTEPVEPSDPTKARITAVSTGGSSGLNNQLTVDGVDNSDDYIGGFLQNFSPDVIREFAVQTSQQNADIGRTTAGSVVISTRSGTNDWHGDFAVFERASALNARFPIENPAPEPKQPFSRQNYVGTIGGPIIKDKVWIFSGFEMVNEHASVNYSPDSLTQFNALNQLAQEGLIPNTSSIAVPPYVRVPYQSYLGMMRFDWAQSQRSQWFLRYALDNSTTNNALVQQATLPSTGATTHSNYQDGVISNTFTFSPSWVGNFTFGTSYLHGTAARNGYLGFALAFPFSSTSKTISGFETYGDNQFVTPITAFPVVRNQEKYQFRYDVSGSVGRHAPKFGVDFIHEPVLSGAFPGQAETLYTLTENPTYYLTNPAQLTDELYCLPPFRRHELSDHGHSGRQRQFFPECAAARPVRHGPVARDPAGDHQLRSPLGHDLWTIPGFRSQPDVQSRSADDRWTAIAAAHGCSSRLPQSFRAAPGDRLFPRSGRRPRPSRRNRHVLQRSGAEWLGDRVPGRQYAVRVSALPPARRSGLPAGRGGWRCGSGDRSQLPHPICAACHAAASSICGTRTGR